MNEKINYLNEIDINNLPEHVAIIMDGNGRWAKKRNKPRSFGHIEGANRVVEIVRTASNLGIEVLSLFAFSTENWKRPSQEVEKIMLLIIRFIDSYIDELAENNVILHVIGTRRNMPKKVLEKLDYAKNKTKENTGMVLNICLNYGGRLEILETAKEMIRDYKYLSDEEINKLNFEDLEKHLYTKDNANVDLMIRPSGELRVSNFLLYQMAYAEFYFSNVLWPDFNSNEFYKSIYNYQQRDRRFGGL